MHWLFLRGLARERRHWGSFPERFESRVPGATVHTLDLPGMGTERHRASPERIELIADDVRSRWLALRGEHAGAWGLLAMSLGGMVAMAWASAHPEDFERLVLVATSTGDLSRPWRRFSLAILPAAARAFSEKDPVRREARILSMTTRVLADVDAVAREWASYAADAPTRRAEVVRQLRAATRFRAPTRLLVPTLVVAGARDPLADPSCSRMLASQLGAPLALHPDGGHELALDAPDWLADRVQGWLGETPALPFSTAAVRAEPFGGPAGLPLVVEPAQESARSVGALVAFVLGHRAALEASLVETGALLLRGFDVVDAAAFERVARAASPALGNQYLGTSPRNALTEYTFSASELPSYYPIPQHCEMSFLAKPPRRLFFSCLTPSSGPGGETPLCDFRRVLRDLDPEVRRRFEEKGVKNIRNYVGPGGGSRLDPWKLKRWDELFQTEDRAVVEAKCRENGFQATWRPGGRLRLVNVQPAIKRHPVTGEAVWFNHSQVFHLSSVPDEYRRVAARQGQLRYQALARLTALAVAHKRRSLAPEDQAMHCTYGDGTPIADRDMDRVRDAIWKNMVFFKWRKGDVLVLDNDSVSHGRMPYTGERMVAVAWA